MATGTTPASGAHRLLRIRVGTTNRICICIGTGVTTRSVTGSIGIAIMMAITIITATVIIAMADIPIRPRAATVAARATTTPADIATNLCPPHGGFFLNNQYNGRVEQKIANLDDLARAAHTFVAKLAPLVNGATLVTLSGELGAGKTAFTKEVAKALGVEEVVTSPTFVLEKIYALPSKVGHPMSDFKQFIHIDAYRLDSATDLAPLGFDEVMKDPSNLIFLEWPERVAEGLPPATVNIAFSVLPDHSRQMQITGTIEG